MDDDSPLADTGVKALKWLVIGLTASMIVLACVLIWAILGEMRQTGAQTGPGWPATLALPDGAVPAAVTRAAEFTVVVTEAGEILLFDADGALTQRIATE